MLEHRLCMVDLWYVCAPETFLYRLLTFSASTSFLASAQPEGRKVLTTYPMFLFYFVVAWLVFSNS